MAASYSAAWIQLSDKLGCDSCLFVNTKTGDVHVSVGDADWPDAPPGKGSGDLVRKYAEESLGPDFTGNIEISDEGRPQWAPEDTKRIYRDGRNESKRLFKGEPQHPLFWDSYDRALAENGLCLLCQEPKSRMRGIGYSHICYSGHAWMGDKRVPQYDSRPKVKESAEPSEAVDLLSVSPLIGEAAPVTDKIASLRKQSDWRDIGVPRKKLIEQIDPTFIHHRLHFNRMVVGGGGTLQVSFKAVDQEAVVEVSGSNEWHPRQKYIATVKFSNYRKIAATDENWLTKARLLTEDNVQVDCSCNAYRYFYRYRATESGYALVPENRPAHATNPAGRGSVCKHLESVLVRLPANYAKIASAMRQFAKGSDVTEAAEPTTLPPYTLGEAVADVEHVTFKFCMGRANGHIRLALGIIGESTIEVPRRIPGRSDIDGLAPYIRLLADRALISGYRQAGDLLSAAYSYSEVEGAR